MARGKLTFFTKEEIERVHRASIRMLEEIGILVKSESVEKMLLDAGASRIKGTKRISISEEIVKRSISSAPKSIILAGRGEVKDIRIPDNDRLYVAPGGEGVYIKDLVKGTTRSPTSKDLIDIAVIANSLPQIDFFWELVGAQEETNDDIKGLVETRTSFTYNNKHLQGGALNAKEAENAIEMASVIVGGRKELARRPIFSSVECPLSPLTFEDGLSEAQVVMSRAGIPVVSMSASMAGLTSPVTIAGTIAQINAENLASLTISQSAKKGAPWIYSSDSVPADLRTGSIDYGSLEAQLMRTAAGQMGRSYGMPVMVAGIGIENTAAMLGSIRDGVPYMINQAFVPSDLASGLGGVDQAAGASIEGLIVDAWVWESAREIIREFETDEDAIAFETIREAVGDGSFLTKKHTMARFRKEVAAAMHPEAVLTGRIGSECRGDLIKKAQAEAKKILSKPKTPVISKDEIRQLDDIIAKARAESDSS
jgi:trimethylamine--corrinoid protein Co-methyltransferase